MANERRGRLAFEAWREHLITTHEALEITGLRNEGELREMSEHLHQEGSPPHFEAAD